MDDISKAAIITKAIEDGYKIFMMQHKYPFTVLHFQLDGDLLDVNVHPTKMELRFSDQEGMYRLVYETVSKCSGRAGRLIPDVHVGKEAPAPKEPPKKESFPEPFEVKRREAMMQEKRAEAKKTAATIYATPGTNATRTEAAASVVRERPNYSSSREEGGFAKSLYEVPENLLKPTERKVDEQAEMEKWTSAGKNPALKLQARPCHKRHYSSSFRRNGNSDFCQTSRGRVASGIANPAGSPLRIGTCDIGSVPETDGPFRGETSLQGTHQRAPHHRPAL